MLFRFQFRNDQTDHDGGEITRSDGMCCWFVDCF